MDSVKLHDLPKDMLIQLIATIQSEKQKEIDECNLVISSYKQECGPLIECKDCFVPRLRKESYLCHNCGNWVCKYHYNNVNQFPCKVCYEKMNKLKI